MTGSHPKLTVQPAPRTKPAKLLRLGILRLIAPEARDHTSGSTHQGIIVMGQPAYRKALLLCLVAAAEATKVSERKWKAAADEALAAFKPIRKSVNSCVEIKIRRVRPESSRRPPRHRRDTCSLDRARTAASSPRNDTVKNCRVHPTH
jgi:hypothetical protein